MSTDTVNIYAQRLSSSSKTIDDLLALGDEALSYYMMAPPVPEIRDESHIRLSALMPHLLEELDKRRVTRWVLWEEYKAAEPEGYSYTKFCEHIGRHKRSRKAVMHLEHKPAEELFFDFPGDKLPYYDPCTGQTVPCPVYISTLPFSGYAYIEALRNQKLESLIGAMNRMVRFYGGMTESVKTDNMRQCVSRSNRYEPTLTDLALQWSCHYDTTFMATRVAAPRDKAAVESTVNSLYNKVYAYLRNMRPRSLAELHKHIRHLLEIFNAARMQKKDNSWKEAFERFEKSLLKPLPERDFAPKTTVNAKVAPDFHIQAGPERHRYSVPFPLIGRLLRVVYDTDHVEVYCGHQRIAFHRRSYEPRGNTTLKEHMPPEHLHYTEARGWDADYFLSQASRIGPATHRVIGNVLGRRAFREQSYNSSLGILKLADRFSPQRLEAACQRMSTASRAGYSMVKNLLDRGLDKVPDPMAQMLLLPEHENIRGLQAYDPS
jgi:transposase